MAHTQDETPIRPETAKRIREILRLRAGMSAGEIGAVLRANYGTGSCAPNGDMLNVSGGKLEINGIPYTPGMVKKLLDEEAAAMSVSAKPLRALPGRTIEEISADIRVHAQNMARSYIIIGRDLIEAKQLLGHGKFLPWLRGMGFGVSAADKWMKLASEVGADSPLAELPPTKVMALLSLPAGEREAFAEANNVDSKSAAEIKRLIKERDEARKQAEYNEAHSRSLFRDYEKQRNAAESLQKEVEALKSATPRTVKVIEAPDDYQALKMQAAHHQAEMEEAAQAAEEAESRAAAAEAELARMKREGGGQAADRFAAVQGAANTFLMAVQLLPYDRQEMGNLYNRQRYASLVKSIREWCDEMADALEGGPLDAVGEVI